MANPNDLGQQLIARYGASPGLIRNEPATDLAERLTSMARAPLAGAIQRRWTNADEGPWSRISEALWQDTPSSQGNAARPQSPAQTLRQTIVSPAPTAVAPKLTETKPGMDATSAERPSASTSERETSAPPVVRVKQPDASSEPPAGRANQISPAATRVVRIAAAAPAPAAPLNRAAAPAEAVVTRMAPTEDPARPAPTQIRPPATPQAAAVVARAYDAPHPAVPPPQSVPATPAARECTEIDLDEITERVTRRLNREMRVESERRGLDRWS